MKSLKKPKKLPRKQYSQSITAVIVVLLVAATGTHLLLSSHAQTPYGQVSASSGTLTGNASVVSASSGNYVQFGTTTSTTLTPNQVFDLSDFTLTLPIDSMGGTGGTDGSQYAAVVIQPAQLEAGFTDDYFKLNSAKQLVFTTPSNGATTTPGSGSNHTRSELHENYTGPGAIDDCWTSSIGGTLTASAVVNAVSVDSDEATIGQIHGNGGAAFVLLYYRPADKEITLGVYGNTSDSTHTQYVVETDVALGQTINYTLSFKNGIITAIVDGHTVTVTADSSWDTYPVKLDLGSYSAAPNTGNPAGDETQVTFSSFSISH